METATATHPPKTDNKAKKAEDKNKPKEYTKEEREAAELRVVEESRKHREEITEFVDDTAKQLEEKLKDMPTSTSKLCSTGSPRRFFRSRGGASCPPRSRSGGTTFRTRKTRRNSKMFVVTRPRNKKKPTRQLHRRSNVRKSGQNERIWPQELAG